MALLMPRSAMLSNWRMEENRLLMPAYSKPKSLMNTAFSKKVNKLFTTANTMLTVVFKALFFVLLTAPIFYFLCDSTNTWYTFSVQAFIE